MANITRTYVANFGRTHTGLATVGYTLSGSSRVTAGVTEVAAGSGIYKATVTHDAAFSGSIVWDAGTSPNAWAAETIVPVDIAVVPPSLSGAPVANSEASLCCDEDIAIWDQGDFAALAPKSQVIASGIDGSIAIASPWILNSTAVDFGANSVAAGHVVILTRPAASFRVPGGDLYGVVSVSGGRVTLRRIGLAAGVGQPPVTATTADIAFEIRTFGPQITITSADVRRAYLLGYASRTLANLREAGEELRQVATLYTLRRAYLTAQKTKDGDYATKLNLVSEALADLTARLQLQWGAANQGNIQSPTTRLSTRLMR